MNQYLQNASHTPIALILFDWCDLGSPILQILATMQQQLNRLEVKFDKILKSKKKGAGDLDTGIFSHVSNVKVRKGVKRY